MSPDITLVFFHACSKLVARLGHIGGGALRARGAIHDLPPLLRGKKKKKKIGFIYEENHKFSADDKM